MSENQLARWRGRNVGIVFQFFQLLPTLSAVENVELALELGGVVPKRERRQRAIDCLAEVGMAGPLRGGRNRGVPRGEESLTSPILGAVIKSYLTGRFIGGHTMTRMKRRLTLLLGLMAGTAVVGMAIAAGAPLLAGATVTPDQFGFTSIRSGTPDGAAHFDLTSPDVQDNHRFALSQIANIFGCNGGNQAPRLRWSGAPAGTQSYAVTMFDPDAPTGSGFWHWLMWDIPASVTTFDGSLPAGAVSGTNDAGLTGYLGPCPPPGDRVHRYKLTVYALDVTSLSLPPSVRAAVVGFSMRLHILGFGRLIGDFSQPA